MNLRGSVRGVLLGCALLFLSGCGIGVGQALTHSTIGPQSSSFSDTPGPSSRVGFTRVNTITLYDTTGIMLAALGTAGNAYNARMEAMDQAARSGARPGDTVTYSYDVVPPAAGTMTSATFGFGSASSGAVADASFSDATVKYWLFDIRSTFAFIDIAENMEMGISLGVLWEDWDGQTPFGEINSSWIGMPLGASLNYTFLPFMSVTPRISIDPLLGPLGLLSAGGHWLWLEAGVRLDARPVDWLLIWADVMHRITPWELGNATGTSTQFGIGAAYMFAGV